MTDNKENLLCPACGKTMKKFYINDANIYIDICSDGCGGIYFDNRELEKILNTDFTEEKDLFNGIVNKTFDIVDTQKDRICPVCGATMVKNGAANGNVEIDICAFCGGKFLDATELQSIKNSQLEEINSKAVAIMEALYQKTIQDNSTGLKEIPGYNKRVGFFCNLVKKYTLNK